MSGAVGPLQRYRALLKTDALRADPAQQLAVEKLEALHRRLGGYEPARKSGLFKKRKVVTPTPPGLYLFGGVGRGKSMLMDLFAETAPVARKRRVHFHAFMAEIHQRLHAWRAANKGKAADPMPQIATAVAEEAWLLCFDELVVNNITDAMILGRLFEGLFAAGVVVVATSNFAPDDLYKGGLQRDRFLPFIAVIKDRLDVMELASPIDHRQVRMKGVPVWISPPGPKADQTLERAFLRLSDGERPRAESLAVQGRQITMTRAGARAAWTDFGALCAQPLGAADYLAIADRYEYLLLSDIPVMTPDRRNEARRFMTLIDALYERRTKLIASAGGAPHALYPAGEGAFEFQRTISRLVEMQTENYVGTAHIG